MRLNRVKEKDENIYSVEVEIETIDFEKAFNNAYQKTIKNMVKRN